MVFKGAIEKVGFTKLLVIIFSLFFFFSIISGLVLYTSLRTPLGPHYAAAHSIITEMQDTLLFKTITINFVFFCMTAMGIFFLGILYSHRIAGPLIKVNRFAKMVGKGQFDQRINFRKKDAIHSLSQILNEMTKEYEVRIADFSSMLGKIEQRLNDLDRSEQKIELIQEVLELDTRIKKDAQDLKL